MSNPRNTAAVLVLVRGGDSETEVLLIERSATVKTHQSQVAFPGGGTEAGEENFPERTALRECFEEVGIMPEMVVVSRKLDPIPTITGSFFVVPVLGKLKEGSVPELVLDAHEVAYAEWVPLGALLNTHQQEYGYPVFLWYGKDQKKRKVWGLTALILDRIFNSAPETL